MTDKLTIELLCELLEERGVEYKTHDIIGGKAVTWHGSVCNWVALPDENGLAVAVYKDYLTPEQAIAATLGSDNEYEAKMDALLCRLTNGKWSKTRQYSLEFMDACISEEFEALYSEEQFSAPVHGTLTAEQVRETVEKHWHDLPDEYDMPEATALPEYSYDWQAIADELNTEQGGETCRLHYGEDDDGYDGWYCDECGGWFQAVRRDGRLVEPKHCQECGRRRTNER